MLFTRQEIWYEENTSRTGRFFLAYYIHIRNLFFLYRSTCIDRLFSSKEEVQEASFQTHAVESIKYVLLEIKSKAFSYKVKLTEDCIRFDTFEMPI